MAELLSALLPALLKKAGESISTEFAFIGGIERKCSELKTSLLAINQVIYDAEEQASKKPAVKSWIAKLKMAACEADDALDELHYEALRSEALRRGHKINSGVRAFFTSHYNPLLFKYRIGKRLQQIVEKIDKLVLQMNRFGFLNCPMPVDERMQTYSYVDEQEVIGRQKERDEIIHMLLSAKSDKLLILPIVGIGGLGKTTLAQLVFNDVKVKAHFQKHMWVCVSENFSVPDIVKGIIDTAIGNDCGLKSDNLELLQQRLREELSQKRYLLVLDDVWNEDEQKWEALRTLLCSCKMGSAVVVTTRNSNVASVMGTVPPLALEQLSQEDSWTLFCERAFRTGVAKSCEFVEIGTKIVQKCSGVPLAINSMGGLLSRKHSVRDWLAILQNNTWEENNILTVLSLSYKHLPSFMKQCFAFCAVFPKDYEIDKDDLIHLWISNGFIPSKETSDIEETGNKVFLELLWRSFFQNAKQTRSRKEEYIYGYKDVTTCKIHDLMHDLAVSISGDECYTLQNLVEINKMPKNVHHLVFPHPHKIGFVMQRCPIIRSLFSLHKNRMDSMKDVRFMVSPCRVLGLHICGNEIFSVEPAYMKHLRYLDLSSSDIKTLPEANLTALKTLHFIKCPGITALPEGLQQRLHGLQTFTVEDCPALARRCRRGGDYWEKVKDIPDLRVTRTWASSLSCLEILQIWRPGVLKTYHESFAGDLELVPCKPEVVRGLRYGSLLLAGHDRIATMILKSLRSWVVKKLVTSQSVKEEVQSENALVTANTTYSNCARGTCHSSGSGGQQQSRAGGGNGGKNKGKNGGRNNRNSGGNGGSGFGGHHGGQNNGGNSFGTSTFSIPAPR
ncbi:hypothetical protein OsJ_18355 [Oryza sativa Japonica Group]|uniref:Uncharacterized protein n=1 Tax=Oryza sativa subsp. japonica TaxID=39947 RepID=B9FPB3_ORYSJ|nr:hypothetical protein OsJ_18355 [Oryza sativa Japonica Group]